MTEAADNRPPDVPDSATSGVDGGAVADAVLTDLLADGQIDVTSWTDLEGLPAEMDALAEQASAIVAHARTWVCQRAGFEPSELCLLRPLAELMDLVAGAFGAVGMLARADWTDLTDGVRATTADLRAVDQWVADNLPVVA